MQQYSSYTTDIWSSASKGSGGFSTGQPARSGLRKDSNGSCSIFSKSAVSLISEPVILEKFERRFIERENDHFYRNIWIFFLIKFKEMYRVLFTRYSAVESGPATWSSFVSFFPPMKTT